MRFLEEPHGQGKFQLEDPLLLDSQLAADERQVRNAARTFAQKALQPRIRDAFRNESTDPAIFREMGDMGLLGPTLPPQYGGAGLNYVSYGLIAREIERVDSAYRTLLSVQSSLVMVPIYAFGSEEQKQNTCPNSARANGSAVSA
jgi:glutaryl-CoA dehydrogenase